MKVRQILVNLLANAVKFTDRGEVVVELEEAAHIAVIRVRDTGIGIAPDALEQIFQPFWQASQGPTRSVGGAGLGLTIAKRMARLAGGDLIVESALGKGTTFTLTLPLRRAE